ncbi:albumin 2-like [Ambystoma mexicanum]|uniref:albumin 2-like n=1 Tax=Ambystoma mexicanum TaxID=8296 RepID=UPI0037E7E1E1
MMSRISYGYILLYTTCCAEPENLTGCFSLKKEEFLLKVAKEIESENMICKESKQGQVNNTISALIFYATKKPNDSWERAMLFGGKHAKFASNCCKAEFMTSDCFQKQTDVLLNHFCTMQSDGPHTNCCIKRESEKIGCLLQLATQESRAAVNTSLDSGHLCDLSRQSRVQALSRSAYEYSRRHTDQSINAILNYSYNISNAVIHCCATNGSRVCLAQLSTFFD